VDVLQVPAAVKPTAVRHMVLWLTVAAYMITYMDRVVISSATPSIRDEFGIDIATMGLVLGAFRWGYALFQIPGGWLGDRIGPRRALTIIVAWWSIFTSITAFAWNAASMAVFRFLFGVGEAGAFPIATRSLSRWVLPSERGYAQGITHAGSRLGAAVTPGIVVAMIAAYGWRMPFYVFGALGLIWAATWFFWYRDTPAEHAWVNPAERELIESSIGARSSKSRRVPWGPILRSSTVWTLSLMYACYAWSIAIYLDWLPTYLREVHKLDLKTMGLYAGLPLLAATVGDLLGGWLSDRIAVRTGNLKAARQWVAIVGFLLAGISVVPAVFAKDPQTCIVLVCLAAFGLETTVGVSWAVPLDIGRDYAGSVSAVMNTCGNIGGAISTTVLGFIVNAFGWERPFLIAAALSLVAAFLFSRLDASREIDFSGETR
jgi:sugar phosphate permease